MHGRAPCVNHISLLRSNWMFISTMKNMFSGILKMEIKNTLLHKEETVILLKKEDI